MDWSKENGKLVKTFSFEKQTELANFFGKIAKHADAINHHPDVSISKVGQMKIELFTHYKNALTEKDYALAKYIDEEYGKVKS